MNGAAVSVWKVVHEPAPAGLHWKTTWTASAPTLSSTAASVPEASAPGSSRVTAGAVLSIVTVRTPVSVVFPATSVIERLQVGVAVGQADGVQGRRVRRGRVAPDRRVGRCARGLDPELDRADAGGRVGGGDRVRDGAGDRRGSGRCGDRPVGAVLSTILVGSCEIARVVGRVGDDRAQVVGAVGDGRRVPVTDHGELVSVPIVVHGPVLPPGRYSKAIEAMSGSVALAVSVTVPRRVSPGSTTPPPGGVVSIATSTDFSVSLLPALSVDRNWTVWTPSFEWSAGAGTTTVVPVWNGPPSILYWVEFTPEPVSTGVSVTVTSDCCGPDGALAVVVGGVLSTRTFADRRRRGRVAGVVGRGARRSYGPSAAATVFQRRASMSRCSGRRASTRT